MGDGGEREGGRWMMWDEGIKLRVLGFVGEIEMIMIMLGVRGEGGGERCRGKGFI
jgi:hypothetical protein